MWAQKRREGLGFCFLLHGAPRAKTLLAGHTVGLGQELQGRGGPPLSSPCRRCDYFLICVRNF